MAVLFGKWLAKPRLGAAGLAVLVGVAAMPALATAGTVVGSWSMNEPSGSTQMVDSSGYGRHSEVFTGVNLNGLKYSFPGWTGNLDALGSLTGNLPSSDRGEIRVLDPFNQLMPSAGSFSIELRLKPKLVNGTLPLPGTGANSSPSYNIVQRGRANDIGGMFKLELMGAGPKMGRVQCTMKAPGFTALTAVSAPIIDGRNHRVECVLDRTLNQLRVVTDGGLSDMTSFLWYGFIEPRDIFGHYLTVGKKPGSTVPADAFAGQIDWITISRG